MTLTVEQRQALANGGQVTITVDGEECILLRKERAELAELEQRLTRVKELIESRQRNRERIIQRRVEELLAPSLEWETKEPLQEPTTGVKVPSDSLAVSPLSPTTGVPRADNQDGKLNGSLLISQPQGASRNLDHVLAR